MTLPFQPPLEPMLAKLSDEAALPAGDGWLFEPKWDGFRTLVFKDGKDVYLQSRDGKPLARYFPEVVEALAANLPERCILDGELTLAKNGRLEFDLLQQRLHPAASRVALLAKETPCAYVAWDLLALGDEDLRERPQSERRSKLVEALAHAKAPVHVTPATQDRAVATDWFNRFEGAGLDGVIAKPPGQAYLAGKRAWLKVKHQRTAECAVPGFRWFKNGKGTLVGSLVLALYDGDQLQPVGVCGAFSKARRAELVKELEPYRLGKDDPHPWKDWADALGEEPQGFGNRWNAGKDMSWEPLAVKLVAEVSYDHMQGRRFRHVAHFQRWRKDKEPKDCRFEQLEVTPPAELMQLFG